MNFANNMFINGFAWFFWPLMLLLLGLAVRYAPWRTLLSDAPLQHRWLGFTLGLIVVWQLSIDLNLGVVVHFIGMSTFALVFGWPLALISGVLAQTIDVLLAPQYASMLAFNALLNVAVPVLGVWWLHQRVERLQPSNPFVFIMGVGFFGTVLTTTLASLLAFALVAAFGQGALDMEIGEYLGYLPIFIFPEAVINGMVISALSILHPHLVQAFDEERYFKHDKHQMILDEHIDPALDLEQSEAPEESDDSRYRPPKEWYEKDDDK
ncbi:energy-coupling factor ABC transporter permease [Marinomonas ostreistagni]|uniref:energy-coupling factor ABC transporter permease n=1 Tax=Marinomonas ostreistagni TaxID=359209 RepID=UPI00194E56B4|nr:energy-coupling factor ABC transporter permease [Marinomonas ostreistagni]MBM6551160.1 energy-coupling factor ABC transporter permease [Marinomonas ostreistagni]